MMGYHTVFPLSWVHGQTHSESTAVVYTIKTLHWRFAWNKQEISARSAIFVLANLQLTSLYLLIGVFYWCDIKHWWGHISKKKKTKTQHCHSLLPAHTAAPPPHTHTHTHTHTQRVDAAALIPSLLCRKSTAKISRRRSLAKVWRSAPVFWRSREPRRPRRLPARWLTLHTVLSLSEVTFSTWFTSAWSWIGWWMTSLFLEIPFSQIVSHTQNHIALTKHNRHVCSTLSNALQLHFSQGSRWSA